MQEYAQSQIACAAASYLPAQPGDQQWQQQVPSQHQQQHPQHKQEQRQQGQDSDEDALTPGNAHNLLQSEFPRSHDLDWYLADDGGSDPQMAGPSGESIMGLQEFLNQQPKQGHPQSEWAQAHASGEWGADYDSIMARADSDGTNLDLPQGFPSQGERLDCSSWTSGDGGSPLARCGSIGLDIGGGDGFGLHCDSWLSSSGSPGLHTVPAMQGASARDSSPRVQQMVPSRSYGGRKGGSLVALDDESDHTPLAANTFRVKTEFGSPRVDSSRHSYGATLFAATSFNAAPFPSVGSPNPFKGNGSKGSPFASSPVPNMPLSPAGGQTDYDSQTFDHAFGGAHFPSAGHAEAAVMQQSHGHDGAGPGMAAALMMMPTIGAQQGDKAEQDAWPQQHKGAARHARSACGSGSGDMDSGNGESGSGSGDSSCFPLQTASMPRIAAKQSDEELRAAIAALQGRTGTVSGRSAPSGEAAAASRASCLERYREKKLRRLESPTIRYMKRKINADARPRYKGRFVKAEDLQLFRQGLLPGQGGIAPST